MGRREGFLLVVDGLFLAAEPGGQQSFRPAGPEIGERCHEPGRNRLRQADVTRRRLPDQRHADRDGDFPEELLAEELAIAEFHLTGMPHQSAGKGADQRGHGTAKERVDHVDEPTVIHGRASSKRRHPGGQFLDGLDQKAGDIAVSDRELTCLAHPHHFGQDRLDLLGDDADLAAAIHGEAHAAQA